MQRPNTIKALFFVCIGLAGFSFGLAQSTFGELRWEERDFNVFEGDRTANAVYLYEYGDNFFEVRNRFIYLITKYHARIKVLEEDGFEHAIIKVPFYQTENRKEKVLNIKAITHNGKKKTFLKPADVYTVDDNENWSHMAFTLPDVRVGSVLEYSYEVQSPFHFNLSGWNFQSKIPKVYSEYNARIPGNWEYNRTLIGEIELDVNEADIKHDCFYIEGYGAADCEVLKYVMQDVPAFKESEKFMLSPKNYRSRLKFELSQYHSLKGYTEKFTKSWNDVDKEFKTDKDIGRQLRKRNFLENHVPIDLLEGKANLEKAKKIYAFVKNHFTWNDQFGVWKDNNVKNAFESKIGNVAEINISMINLLNSAGLKANMMLLATRQMGLPEKSHPVMTDFNYVIAKLDINGETYLLDASENGMPFGMLPFRCLNYYGRVMDFDNDSYWYDIIPPNHSKKTIRALMSIDTDRGVAHGKLSAVSKGYDAIAEWNNINSTSKEAYLNNLEENIKGDFHIDSFQIDAGTSTDNLLIQKIEYEIENIVQDGTFYLNPNIIKFFPSNPFLSSERHYPIDFGYPRDYSFNLNLEIPVGYKLQSLPENIAVALPENLGSMQFKCKESAAHTISVRFNLKLNATHYKSEMYPWLKEFFQKAVDAQTNSYIVLEKG